MSIVGPEATGKTTLARTLAEKLATTWVPERTKIVAEFNGASLIGPEWTDVVRGQIASEEALARNADRILICDSDPLATTVWAETLLGSCPQELHELARRPYDLTLLTAPEAPGDAFSVRCEQALRDAGRPYVMLTGGWEERVSTAMRAVDALAGRG